MSEPSSKQVTVFFFHPFPRRSKANRALKEAAQACPGIEIRDLYELYPDFGVDQDAEQEVLLRTDIVVFQHPFYWYSCPALMKEWLDEVLELGWAYGAGGTKLHGKYWLQAITTGGPNEAYSRTGYNRFEMLELLRPFEQTAKLCGMPILEPFIVHGTHSADEHIRAQHTRRYKELLSNLTKGILPPPYSSEGK